MPKSFLITGSSGYIGKALVPDLYNYNVTKYIRDQYLFNQDFDVVIHLAAYVGGIATTSQHQTKSLVENLSILNRAIELASSTKKKTKLILASSACSYPADCKVPFSELDLHNGKPSQQVYGYGYAKRIMSVLADLSKESEHFDITTLILTNVYGVYNDSCESFDPQKSHVTGALIKKFVDAKHNNFSNVTLWGDGSATRDFVHIKDVVNAFLIAANSKHQGNYNIANGQEISISELAELIKRLTDYKGDIFWDTSKPTGASRRCLDVSKAKSELGWSPSVRLEDGLKQEIEWYIIHHQNQR